MSIKGGLDTKVVFIK